MKKSAIVVFLLVFVGPVFAFSQFERDDSLIRRVTEPLSIDGFLDEEIWQLAPEANSLLHIPSDRSDLKRDSTSIRILFNEEFLFIGFRCLDSEPDKIMARTQERDNDLRVDDSVYLLIDVLSERPVYYFLAVNVLGTRSDALIEKEGTGLDPRWNGDWEAACRIQDFGWSAEIAIDLNTLFPMGKLESLGISFSRVVARDISLFWSGILDPMFNLGELGRLPVLVLKGMDDRLRITPYILGDTSRTHYAGGGLDVRFRVSDSLDAQVTFFPDFQNEEADPELMNLTRFELKYPEKRDFFREADYLDRMPLSLFYSKRIGNITGGAHVQGRWGRMELSGLSVLQDTSFQNGDETANFSVFRLARTAGNWTMGVQSSNKLTDGQVWGTVGIDTAYRISPAWRVDGQFAASYGEYESGNLAMALRTAYRNKKLLFHCGYTHLGDKFGENVNPVGFIPDDNRHELDAVLEKTFPVKHKVIGSLLYDSRYDIYWGTDGTLRSWQVDQGLVMETVNRFSIGVYHREEFKLYEKEFRNKQTRMLLGFNLKEDWQKVLLMVSFGNNFDASYDMIEIVKRLKPTEDFIIEYHLTRLKYSRQAKNMPHARSGWIHNLRMVVHMSAKVNGKIYFQYNTKTRVAQGAKQANKRFSLQAFLDFLLSDSLFLQVGTRNTTTEFGLERPDGPTAFCRVQYIF